MFKLLGCICLASFLSAPIASQLTTFYEETDYDASVHVELDETLSTVTITMTVVSSRWVGVGFGSQSMSNTYAIVATGTTSIAERKLGGSGSRAGSVLSTTVNVESDSITGGVRTIVLSRDVDVSTACSDCFDFSDVTQAGDTIDFIFAVGSGTTLSNHGTGRRWLGTLTFAIPTEAPSRIPSGLPTLVPSNVPSEVSMEPTRMPTSYPTVVSSEPTYAPVDPDATDEPSSYPSKSPTNVPSIEPSYEPTLPLYSIPTSIPTTFPTFAAEVATASFNSSDEADDDLSAQISVLDDNSVLLQLSGPAGQWIGFGFGAQKMDGTYAIIVDGNGVITERTLASGSSGTLLAASEYEEITNDAIDGVRQVLLKADVNDLDNYDFSALVGATSLDYIIASSPAVSLETHSWREFGEAAIEVSVAQTDGESGNVTSTYGGTDSSEEDSEPVADVGSRSVCGVFGLFGVVELSALIAVVVARLSWE